jgi:hypothetical protein
LIWDSSVDVKDLPFLGLWVILFPGLDWLSFNISSHVNIKDVVVLDVDEVLVLVLEYLPPSWLNLFEAEDVSSGSLVSWCSNSEECMLWLISSNRLGPVVEVPFLWIETVCCLDDWLALNNIEISAGLKSRDNEEKSLNIHTEFGRKLSLLGIRFHLIDVHDLPLLGSLLGKFGDHNVLVVLVLSIRNIKCLSLLIENEVTLWFEHLEPSCVGLPELNIVWSATALNLERVGCVGNWLDGLGLLVEWPLLIFLVDSIADDDVSSANNCEYSSHWESWDNVECSVDPESELLVESLNFITLGLVDVDDLPSLVETGVLSPDNNLLAFWVLVSLDIEDLSWLGVDELLVLILEKLPPSWVSSPGKHVVCLTRVLNVPWLSLVTSWLDGLWLLIEPPLLGIVTVGSLNDKVVTDNVKISSGSHERNNEERSFDVESEVLVDLSLRWNWLNLISVNNWPSLSDTIVLVGGFDVSVLVVSSTW